MKTFFKLWNILNKQQRLENVRDTQVYGAPNKNNM
jgi:hypothetical protein